MREWSVTRYDDDTYRLDLTETPDVWVLADMIYGAFIDITGHRLCCNLPDALWKIPTTTDSEPDETGYIEGSLASRIYNFVTEIEFAIAEKAKTIDYVNITPAQAREFDPRYVALFDDDDVDYGG